ncbi:MAG TPA: hypothetical protein VHX66_08050 [Solirubrobacteraceae bacterium]|nr:hypothetical protein [Solirubrobacteraceae bacterium]
MVGFAVTGCGSAAGTSSQSASSAATTTTTTAQAGCTVYMASADVRVTFSTSNLCSQAVKNWSGNGEYWQRGDPIPTDSLSETCALSNGSSTVIVEDSGSAISGTDICGNLVHKDGWTQDQNLPSVGPAEAAQQQAEAQSASESQSQSNMATEQAAASSVLSDMSQLQSDEGSAATDGAPSAFANDLASGRTDVGTTYSDLQHVLGEQGSADAPTICSDADTVSSDADSVQSDADSVQSDLDSSNEDVSSINSDIGQLRQDEAQLQQDMATDPADAPANPPTTSQVASAIKTGHHDAATAAANGNRALGQANGMVKTAQGYASRAQAVCSATG